MSYTTKPYGKDKNFRCPAWFNDEAMLAILNSAAQSRSVEELLENSGLSGKVRPESFQRFRCRAQHSEKDHALRVYIDLFDSLYSEVPKHYFGVAEAVHKAIARFKSVCECGDPKEPLQPECDRCRELTQRHTTKQNADLEKSRGRKDGNHAVPAST